MACSFRAKSTNGSFDFHTSDPASICLPWRRAGLPARVTRTRAMRNMAAQAAAWRRSEQCEARVMKENESRVKWITRECPCGRLAPFLPIPAIASGGTQPPERRSKTCRVTPTPACAPPLAMPTSTQLRLEQVLRAPRRLAFRLKMCARHGKDQHTDTRGFSHPVVATSPTDARLFGACFNVAHVLSECPSGRQLVESLRRPSNTDASKRSPK